MLVSLHTPKEKLWGELVTLQVAGITIRGIDLNSFDDFIRQVMEPDGARVGLPTVFPPMQRIEARGAGLNRRDRFLRFREMFKRKNFGKSLREYLELFV